MKYSLHAYLSKEAKEGWRDFTDENGVSISGMLEFIGLAMTQDPEFTLIMQDEVVKGARVIDVGRRRRS